MHGAHVSIVLGSPAVFSVAYENAKGLDLVWKSLILICVQVFPRAWYPCEGQAKPIAGTFRKFSVDCTQVLVFSI